MPLVESCEKFDTFYNRVTMRVNLEIFYSTKSLKNDNSLLPRSTKSDYRAPFIPNGRRFWRYATHFKTHFSRAWRGLEYATGSKFKYTALALAVFQYGKDGRAFG